MAKISSHTHQDLCNVDLIESNPMIRSQTSKRNQTNNSSCAHSQIDWQNRTISLNHCHRPRVCVWCRSSSLVLVWLLHPSSSHRYHHSLLCLCLLLLQLLHISIRTVEISQQLQ